MHLRIYSTRVPQELNVTDQNAKVDQGNLVTVAQRRDELSASILVSVLEDAGIRAVATGGFTSGFRAEAPGMVKIQTFEQDAERAREVIAEIKQEPQVWDQEGDAYQRDA